MVEVKYSKLLNFSQYRCGSFQYHNAFYHSAVAGLPQPSGGFSAGVSDIASFVIPLRRVYLNRSGRFQGRAMREDSIPFRATLCGGGNGGRRPEAGGLRGGRRPEAGYGGRAGAPRHCGRRRRQRGGGKEERSDDARGRGRPAAGACAPPDASGVKRSGTTPPTGSPTPTQGGTSRERRGRAARDDATPGAAHAQAPQRQGRP